MDNNINNLSGVEFENLCQALLQKLGFKVETTKQSGDGGIDLVAYNYQAFLSGKYIVQCKRYSGGVGEPIVRDLYGVVTAERANKGILMTTGYFSMSAIKFASDKNIELIDGEQLGELLYKNDLLTDGGTTAINVFTQHKCFDSSKYDFFKSMINQNMCTVEMGEDFLFFFMFDYLKNAPEQENNEYCAMINDGFAEEYLRLFDWYTGKYYKRGKQQLEALPYYIHKYRGIAQLYNFDLFEYVQNRYDILTKKNNLKLAYYKDGSSYSRDYYLSRIPEEDRATILDNLMNTDVVKYIPSYRFYELMNLLSLFSYFNIIDGIDQVNKVLFGDTPEFKTWVQTRWDYQKSMNNFQINYSKITQWLSRGKYDHTTVEHEGILDMCAFFDLFSNAHREKIDMEIKKIYELLKSVK